MQTLAVFAQLPCAITCSISSCVHVKNPKYWQPYQLLGHENAALPCPTSVYVYFFFTFFAAWHTPMFCFHCLYGLILTPMFCFHCLFLLPGRLPCSAFTVCLYCLIDCCVLFSLFLLPGRLPRSVFTVCFCFLVESVFRFQVRFTAWQTPCSVFKSVFTAWQTTPLFCFHRLFNCFCYVFIAWQTLMLCFQTCPTVTSLFCFSELSVSLACFVSAVC